MAERVRNETLSHEARMAEFRRFTAHTGGRTAWINIDAITYIDANERGVVSLHFVGGDLVTVHDDLDAIMKDLLPTNRSGPRTS